MNKLYILILFLAIGTAAHAQTGDTDNGQANGKPYMSERFVEGLLMVDQQRFAFSADQAAKAKVVWTTYATKFNAMSQNVTNAADYKAGIRALDMERIKQYKTFLNADQYTKLVTTYNKLHPKSPIEP